MSLWGPRFMYVEVFTRVPLQASDFNRLPDIDVLGRLAWKSDTTECLYWIVAIVFVVWRALSFILSQWTRLCVATLVRCSLEAFVVINRGEDLDDNRPHILCDPHR